MIGAAFNEILLPNECIEVTQLLACKNFEHWSVDAAQAFSKVTQIKYIGFLLFKSEINSYYFKIGNI